MIRTTPVLVNGEALAVALATELARRSQSFAFEPLPCELYEFRVKNEIVKMVCDFIVEHRNG